MLTCRWLDHVPEYLLQSLCRRQSHIPLQHWCHIPHICTFGLRYLTTLDIWMCMRSTRRSSIYTKTQGHQLNKTSRPSIKIMKNDLNFFTVYFSLLFTNRQINSFASYLSHPWEKLSRHCLQKYSIGGVILVAATRKYWPIMRSMNNV